MSGDSRFFAQFGGGGGGGGGISQLEVGVTPIAFGNVGRLLFEGTGNVLQESANLFWDITNNRLGIRTLQPDCTLDVVSTGTSNVRGIQGTHYDNTNAFSPSKMIGRRARGTEASPSAVLLGDALASFNGRGRKATAWSDTVGGYYVSANENWTNTATGTFLSFRGVNNGSTTVSEWMRVVGGNVGINQTTPTSLLNIKGTDTSASTTSLYVQDSADAGILAVRNNSSLDFINWGDSTVNSIKRIGLNNTSVGTQLQIESFGTANNTTGFATINVGIVSSFSPASGISRYTNLSVTPTINQTGTATGITRGIHIDPTLTAASSFRAIETSNDSGYSFYGAGTAPMYINGRIGVGRTTAGASVDIQAAGALSTDVAFRVRNSADTADILAIQGNNQVVKGASTVIVANVQAVVSAATVTATSGNDLVVITAQTVGLTLANPTGTWTQGQSLMIRIKDNGISQTIAYGGKYRAIGVTLPVSTTATKTTYLGVVYNSTDDTFDVIGVSTQA